MMSSSLFWLSKLRSSLKSFPLCSIKILSVPLIITSVMLSSFRIEFRRPKPRIEP